MTTNQNVHTFTSTTGEIFTITRKNRPEFAVIRTVLVSTPGYHFPAGHRGIMTAGKLKSCETTVRANHRSEESGEWSFEIVPVNN